VTDGFVMNAPWDSEADLEDRRRVFAPLAKHW